MLVINKFSNGCAFKIAFSACILLFLYYIFVVNTPHQYRNYIRFISTKKEVTQVATQFATHTTVRYDSTTKIPTKRVMKYLRRGFDNCSLIICSMGNLGNQIWEYMSLFVVWKRFLNAGYTPYIQEHMFKNLKVLFPKLSIHSSRFIDRLCNTSKKSVILKKQSLEKYTSWFNYNNDEICDDVFLDDYSSRYDEILAYGFDKIVQEEISFSPSLVEECQGTLHYYKNIFNLTHKDVTFVGMHYRGGDYLHHLEVTYPDYNVIIPDYNYYLKAMKYFEERYDNVIFFFITIDMDWLSQNVIPITSHGKIVVNPYVDDKIHDLVLLSHCNHSIINYGTFGTTSALFAGGTTFVYDLKLPLDHRGSTIAMGIANILKNWYIIR